MSNTKIKAGQFSGIVGNGTDGYFLMTNGDGTMAWEPAGAPSPTVTSVTYPGDDTAADPAGGQSVTLTGTNFVTGATVTIGGTTAPTVSFVSATELTITTPAKAAGDYDIVVTNTDGGTATFVDGISYNGIPSWTTASGSLGTFASDTTISTITLQASEPDAGTITFNITSGALPTGLSLTGADIDGTTSKETADTLYNFTVTAIDDENQSTPRAFSITVEKYIVPAPENFEIVTYTGNGGTQAITSKIGKAASFNGSSSYIESTSLDYATLPTNTAWAVSCWINLGSTSITTTALSLMNPSSPFSGWALFIQNGTVQLAVNGSSPTAATGSFANLSANTWMHVVLSYDGSGTTTIYYNGNFGATVSQTISASTNGNFRIGYAGVWSYFNGKIDQVRIFDKALSSGEVSTLYGETYASSTKSTTDIFNDGSGVALYELDEDAKVSGGNPNQGFEIDSTQSATFNGSSSSVNLGSTNQFASSGVSVSMWINASSVTTNQVLIGNSDGGSFAEGDFYINLRSDGYIGYQIGQSSSIYEARHSTTTQLSVGNWYHITVTFDSSLGTTIGKIYVNGTLQSTSATYAAGGTFSGDVFIGTLDLQLGKRNITGSELWYNGKMDEVRIYSSVLTPSEIINTYIDYNIPTNNLVSLYKLDGDATDEQGNYNGIATSISYSGTVPQVPSHPYNGTPTNLNFLGMAFQPDLVWVKSRSGAYNAVIFDSVRTVGGNKELTPSETYAEGGGNSSLYGYVSSLDSNGFTLTAGSTNSLLTNNNGDDYVAWCWKAGGAVTPNNNTNGDITSTVSANQDAGFSIVKYTGASGTVGHGLGSTPEMIIQKSTSASQDWYVYFPPGVIDSNYNYMILNSTASKSTTGSTPPTTTTFNPVSTSGDYIAYCFHSVDGYQKIGSYSGTGGSSVNTISFGFSPRFVLIKRTDNTGNWRMYDAVRDTGTLPFRINHNLRADTSAAEYDGTNDPVGYMSFTNDGIEFSTSETNSDLNASGGTYIYLAIA